MNEMDALDKIDTLRWVSFLIDTTVLTVGADTKKAINFLSEVTATVYIIRGMGTANEFVIDFADAIHFKVNKYKESKGTDFIAHAKTRMTQDVEAVKLAKLMNLMIHAVIPASEEVKKDSMLSIFAGVYLCENSLRKHPMLMALCMCTSYILADADNTQDLNDLSVLIMDSIIDKSFQKTVKRLVEYENSFHK